MGNNNYKNNKGFTLMEVILVMFIVSLTFVGIYSSLAKNNRHEKDNRYGIIASNLAQEGAEIIRNKRDENLLRGESIDFGFNNGVCSPYRNSGNSSYCDVSRPLTVGINANGFYENCGSSDCTLTVFNRFCNIDTDDEVMKVECTVEWESPSLETNKSVTIESILTNWQEN